MKRLCFAIALIAAAPTAALAASYISLSVDKSALSMTDLRSPRQTGDKAETYEVLIYRAPVKAKKGMADYVINRVNFDCTRHKVSRFYSASYSSNGDIVGAEPTPKPWSKIIPGSKEEALSTLGCHGLPPKTGIPFGDVRVGQVMAKYRAGAYDRFIH